MKQDANGEVYFENKESGLKFKVPTGWNYSPSQMASIVLTSSDFADFREIDMARSFVPKTGCWIGVKVKKEIADTSYDITYTSTKHKIEGNYLIDTESDTYKKTTIGKYNALISNHLSDVNNDNVGNFLSAAVAEKNYIYSIDTSLFGQDKEKCSQIFNDFLNSILIN